jgi:hypothetical protein
MYDKIVQAMGVAAAIFVIVMLLNVAVGFSVLTYQLFVK